MLRSRSKERYTARHGILDRRQVVGPGGDEETADDHETRTARRPSILALHGRRPPNPPPTHPPRREHQSYHLRAAPSPARSCRDQDGSYHFEILKNLVGCGVDAAKQDRADQRHVTLGRRYAGTRSRPGCPW
jgi:hypothetical protein